jgi:hypothetical protein
MLGLGALLATLLLIGIPICPMAFLLHVPCPGCGLTRATLRLLHGDIHGAMAFHPLALLMVPTLGAYFGFNAVGYVLYNDWGIVESRLGRACNPIFTVLLITGFATWIARFFGAFGGPVPV